jgi:6-phosphogluconolactonase/glucosamine-6-phosphate isomerase/deaminase
MDVHVSDHPAQAAAEWIAVLLADAVGRRGSASLALSGGSTAPALIAALAAAALDWPSITAWQVDERIAPDGDPDRNAGQLQALPCRVELMPVTAAPLAAAAERYAATLPARFDVVHLGLGDDGHTASWPPGNAAVRESTALVELVPEFNGRRRMTLTPVVVNAARKRLVLAVGSAKRPVAERWLLDDTVLPISAVRRAGTAVFLDFAAAPGV